MRLGLVLLAPLASLAACSPGASDTVAAAGLAAPSLVVVTVDSLGAEHLSVQGYFRETTPNLDRLATEEAVLFERAYTPIATSLPAHVALWTGRHPAASGVMSGGVTVARREGVEPPLFLAEDLARLGYDTAAFLGTPFLGGAAGVTAGFAHVEEPDQASPARPRRAYLTTNRVLAWLAERESAAPLLLWVHYADPRAPYSPPPEHLASFRGGQALTDYLERTGYPDPRSARVRADHDGYDGELHYVDAELGRLLAGLPAHLDPLRTALVVTSPHGEGLGRHGTSGHGRVFEEQVHVPLLLKLPGVPGGRRVAAPVSLIDVLPTLARALELDLAPAFGSGFDGGDVLSETLARGQVVVLRTITPDRRWGTDVKACLVSANWKLHVSSVRGPRLFDLAEDPRETRDLVPTEPAVTRRLTELLRAELARLSGPVSPFVVRPEPSAETSAGLRTLGLAR